MSNDEINKGNDSPVEKMEEVKASTTQEVDVKNEEQTAPENWGNEGPAEDDNAQSSEEDTIDDTDYVNKNVTINQPVAEDHDTKVHPSRRLSMPPSEAMNHIVGLLTKLVTMTEAQQKAIPDNEAMWLSEWQNALRTPTNEGAYRQALKEEGSDWRQGVMHEGINYAATKPKFADKGNGAVITGDHAIYHVNALCGQGSIINVPLWNTGIWVTIKAPKNSVLLDLDKRLAETKIELGNSTAGLIYANDSMFLTMEAVNLALQCITISSLQDSSFDNLEKTIKVQDIPFLLTGLAAAIYPEGYPLARPCIDKKCMHITEQLLRINRLMVVDNNKLTKEQRQHMSNRTGKFSMEEITKYQDAHKWVGEKDFVALHDGKIKVKFKMPSIRDYKVSGSDWINGIVSTMESSLTTTLQGPERNDYIHEQGVLTALRQYGHWISHVVTSTEYKIEDTKTLTTILEHLSGDPEITESFFDSVAKFIEETAIGIIAIPKYRCQKCNKEQQVEEEKTHPALIPLDPLDLFFTLATQRLMAIIG